MERLKPLPWRQNSTNTHVVGVYTDGAMPQSIAPRDNTSSVEPLNLHEAKSFTWGPGLSSCASSFAAVNIKVLLYWLNLHFNAHAHKV